MKRWVVAVLLGVLASSTPFALAADDDADDDDEAEVTYEEPAEVHLPEGPARPLSGPILVVEFRGMVNPGMGDHVSSALERARREHAQALLIELDTPGGLVSTTQQIVQEILRAPLPVIVFVSPSGAHAASAGTFITLAAHIAAMAPATRLGAAHPVTGSGQDPEAEGGKHMGRKVENDLAAFMEGIAKERHRNVSWAIDAVRRSVSVNADRALELGVIDLVARDRADLLDALEGRQVMVAGEKVELHPKDAPIIEARLSVRDWVLNLLATPGVAMILGVLGLVGILVEVYHPGMFAPGVMGILCLICSLISMEQLPIDIGAALLVLAGLGLIVAEIYATTHGLLALLGGLGLTVGLLLLIDTENPSYLVDRSFALTLWDILPTVALLLGLVAYLSLFVLRKHHARSVTGSEGLIGVRGVVMKDVDPSDGTVMIQGEYWRARATTPIAAGLEVEVTAVRGLEVEVRRV